MKILCSDAFGVTPAAVAAASFQQVRSDVCTTLLYTSVLELLTENENECKTYLLKEPHHPKWKKNTMERMDEMMMITVRREREKA